MIKEQALEKMNRINILFSFYEFLLTEKQQYVLQLYFHEDFSLAEIAEHMQISRQAVFEHIKRAEQVLDTYEQKLQLLKQHEEKLQHIAQIEALIANWEENNKDVILNKLEQLK
ncbi:YlxM family DNA-binding protein [Longirhabdus pacifica]|uniref:YlxM family DNA-binding protein n=1 Tax=Longirhabdus pacifica TaxID=2305227 RepID=UPI001009035B|nr:sigma factor-like helix-turn-helix DNA-binding protein [Longirhabdus pacifica]